MLGLLLLVLLYRVNCECQPASVVVGDWQSLRTAFESTSEAICIDGFFAIPRDAYPLNGNVLINRTLLVTGKDGLASGFNASTLSLFATDSGARITFRNLTIVEGWLATVNWPVFNASFPGHVTWENAVLSGYAFNLNASQMAQVYVGAGAAFPATGSPQDGYTIVNASTLLMRNSTAPYPMFYRGLDEIGYHGFFIEWTNMTLLLQPGIPPYHLPYQPPIDQLEPWRIVCQNNTDKGFSYRGFVSHTSDGYRCQKWHSMLPMTHATISNNFPDAGLLENYCRNPETSYATTGFQGAVCFPDYIMQRGSHYCPIPWCEDLSDVEIMERHARIVKSYKAGKITELWQQLGVSAPKAKGLAKSARLGIGIGVGVGGCLLLAFAALAAILLLRRRRNRSGKYDAQAEGLTDKQGSGSQPSDPETGNPLGGIGSTVLQNFDLKPVAGSLQLVSLLGYGGTASVYLGLYDQTPVAVKVLVGIQEAKALAECLMGLMVVHPHVCRIYGYFRTTVALHTYQEGDKVVVVPMFRESEATLYDEVSEDGSRRGEVRRHTVRLDTQHLSVGSSNSAVVLGSKGLPGRSSKHESPITNGGGARDRTPNEKSGSPAPVQSMEALCICMEYCDMGSLFHLMAAGGTEAAVTKEPGSLPLLGAPDLRLSLTWAIQMASGLAQIHARGIVHGDFKSLNVMMTSQKQRVPAVKVADFGTALFMGARPKRETIMVTVMYLCPETRETGVLTPAGDIYAMGIVLWELMHPSWMTSGGQDITGVAPATRITSPTPLPIAQLIAECTSLDPAKRPTATELLERLRAIEQSLGLGSVNPMPVTGLAPGLGLTTTLSAKRVSAERMTASEVLGLHDRTEFVTGPLKGPWVTVGGMELASWLEERAASGRQDAELAAAHKPSQSTGLWSGDSSGLTSSLTGTTDYSRPSQEELPWTGRSDSHPAAAAAGSASSSREGVGSGGLPRGGPSSTPPYSREMAPASAMRRVATAYFSG